MQTEADVRFQVIDVIIRRLGYSVDPETYVLCEPRLDYPYSFVGRRSKKDVPVGAADYICGLKGRRGSFVVEAKGPNSELTKESWEQAHSYAAHPSVGAQFILICNGTRIALYETLTGRFDSPVFHVSVDELNADFHLIANVLAPARLSAYATRSFDLAKPLGPGLPSMLKILRGKYTVSETRVEYGGVLQEYLQIPGLKEKLDASISPTLGQIGQMIYSVSGGMVFRGDDGRIHVDVEFEGSTKNNDAGMKALGLKKVLFVTDRPQLEHTEEGITFEVEKFAEVKPGDLIYPMFGEVQVAPFPMEVDMYLGAVVDIDDNLNVEGIQFCQADFVFEHPVLGSAEIKLQFMGPLQLDCATC